MFENVQNTNTTHCVTISALFIISSIKRTNKRTM